jgi:protein NrfD
MRPLLLRVRPPGVLGHVVAVLGGLAGLYLAGYTGVLLAVTNRPIWSDTPLLGMLFIVSAASTSAALMILLADRYRLQAPSLAGLHRFDQWVIALEIMVVLIVIASLGPVARAWLNVWGVLLATAILIGMIIPLILLRRAGRPRFLMSVPILVLIGGFLLRCVIIFSSESM